MSDKTAKYQVYEVNQINHYEWEKKNLFRGMFGKPKTTTKTGTREYSSIFVVEENREKALEKINKRYTFPEVGKIIKNAVIDRFIGGYRETYCVKDAKLIKVELPIKIPDVTMKDLHEKLQYNDFFRLATYYDMAYKEILTTVRDEV